MAILSRSDLYELCASVTARHFGPLRRAGGDTSALAAASDATVVAPDNAGLQRIEANGAIRPVTGGSRYAARSDGRGRAAEPGGSRLRGSRRSQGRIHLDIEVSVLRSTAAVLDVRPDGQEVPLWRSPLPFSVGPVA